MDLRTIKTFHTIVKYGSFQKAADYLNYAQSTVTTHIKKLENDLGVILLDRSNHLQLTEAGKLLYEKGELLLKTYEDLSHSMGRLIDGKTTCLKVGVMEPMASYIFPSIMSALIEKIPELQISINIYGSQQLAEMIESDELDVALCAEPKMIRHSCYEHLYYEEVGLLVQDDHGLANVEQIELAHLKDEKLIITNSACPFRANLEDRLLASGIVPKYGLEVSNMLTLKYYVQSGFGPAIVPKVTVNEEPQQTTFKIITDFQQGLSVGVFRKINHPEDEVLQTFIKVIKKSLQN